MLPLQDHSSRVSKSNILEFFYVKKAKYDGRFYKRRFTAQIKSSLLSFICRETLTIWQWKKVNLSNISIQEFVEIVNLIKRLLSPWFYWLSCMNFGCNLYEFSLPFVNYNLERGKLKWIRKFMILIEIFKNLWFTWKPPQIGPYDRMI